MRNSAWSSGAMTGSNLSSTRHLSRPACSATTIWKGHHPATLAISSGRLVSFSPRLRSIVFGISRIPIPTTRLRQVAHNAMAIDILTLLCYRLPLIEENSTEIVTWRQLTAQFGNRGEPVYQFKDTFTDSIKLALRAYPEARVDLVDAGLQLRHSDPAALRRAFFVLPGARALPPVSKRRPKLGLPKLSSISMEVERK